MKKPVCSGGDHGGRRADASDARAQHKAPNQQPPQAKRRRRTGGDTALGTVRLPKGVTADGKPLPAGTYTVN